VESACARALSPACRPPCWRARGAPRSRCAHAIRAWSASSGPSDTTAGVGSDRARPLSLVARIESEEGSSAAPCSIDSGRTSRCTAAGVVRAHGPPRGIRPMKAS